MNPVKLFKTNVIGLNIMTKKRIIGYTIAAILSGNAAAIDFGITSEKIIIVTVNIADAKPILNPYSIAIVVTKVGRSIFAILFPIRIVVINSLGFETKFKSFSDFLSPLFAFVYNLILFVAVNAVSLPEKKNETNNKKMIAMITGLFPP